MVYQLKDAIQDLFDLVKDTIDISVSSKVAEEFQKHLELLHGTSNLGANHVRFSRNENMSGKSSRYSDKDRNSSNEKRTPSKSGRSRNSIFDKRRNTTQTAGEK